MAMAPGGRPGRTSKLSPPQTGRVPPAEGRRARPPTTSSATIPACRTRASAAPGASGRVRSGSSSGGGGGSNLGRSPSGDGPRVTGIDTPKNNVRGASVLAPLGGSDGSGPHPPAPYFPGGGGVKPITWTPAPCPQTLAPHPPHSFRVPH